MKLEEYLTKVEERIKSKGRIVSEWVKSERNVEVEGITAALVMQGNMKQLKKGLILSRLSAAMTVPDWNTAALFFLRKGETRVSDIQKIIRATRIFMARNDITWAWLCLVSKRGFSSKVKDFVRGYLKRELGVFLVDLGRNEIYSRSLNDPVARNGFKLLDPLKVEKEKVDGSKRGVLKIRR